MNDTIKKEYNEKDIDFSKPLNTKIYDIMNAELIEISGGCKGPVINPIRVNEYFLRDGEKPWTPKRKTTKGIVCNEAFSGKTDERCEECKFYGKEALIYEYISIVRRKRKKSQ